MNAKQYVQNALQNIQSNLNVTNQQLNNRSKVNTLAAVGVGILALGLLASHPVFTIPLAGLAASFVSNRLFHRKTLGATKKRLEGEKKHLEDMLKNGLSFSKETNEKRKAEINKLKTDYEKQEKLFNETAKGNKFTNLVALGTTMAACLYPGTILCFAALGTLVIKYISDHNLADKKVEIEEAAEKVNNLTNDYNVGVYAYAARQRRAQQAQPQQTQARTQARQQTRQAAPQPQQTRTQTRPNSQPVAGARYSKEDERAVDEYLRQMQKGGAETKGFQKRKI